MIKTKQMPSKMIDLIPDMSILIPDMSILIIAGGMTMFVEELAIKIALATTSLIVASTATFFYKKWLENKYKDNCKCKDNETNKKF